MNIIKYVFVSKIWICYFRVKYVYGYEVVVEHVCAARGNAKLNGLHSTL